MEVCGLIITERNTPVLGKGVMAPFIISKILNIAKVRSLWIFPVWEHLRVATDLGFVGQILEFWKGSKVSTRSLFQLGLLSDSFEVGGGAFYKF